VKTLAVASIVLSVAAQFLLKAGMCTESVRQSMGAPFSTQTVWAVLSDVHIICGFFFYGLAAMAWLSHALAFSRSCRVNHT
jgi:hypothetical protein